jgi:hypothetical protein
MTRIVSFSKLVPISFLILLTMSGPILAGSTNAQTLYPIPNQAVSYPLKTQISPAQIAEFNQIFQFGKFDPKKAIALRDILQPLATANDPVATYWLAKTYDWYEFGIGQEKDSETALKWYRQAAELNYIDAVYFLYQAYLYGFLNVKEDKAEAAKWLNRAYEIGSGEAKSRILIEFAGWSDPNADKTLPTIPKNAASHLEYLRQAFILNPNDGRVADYYGDRLYKAKRYAEALSVLSKSDNPYTWRQVGRMYERGEGTLPSIPQALIWYKKMAIEGKEKENDLNPITLYGRQEIYRLMCLKKITPEQAAPVPTDTYEAEFGQWSDAKCNFSPG